MKKLLIALGVIAAVVLAALLIWPMVDGGLREDNATDSLPETTGGQTNTNNGQNSGDNGDQPVSNEEVVATIVYTGTAFEPAQVTVKAGSLVRFVNESDRNAQISSDDHPTHKKNSELNLAALGPGEGENVKLGNAGTWGIHDHLNPNVVGQITVQ